MSDDESKELQRIAASIAVAASVFGVQGHWDHALNHAAIEGGALILSTTVGPQVNLRLGRLWGWVRERLGAQRATEAIKTPEGIDVLSAIFRSLLEAPDDAALPVLAALAREYIAGGRKPDRFLRGVARMVCDCEPTELVALMVTFEEAAKIAKDQHQVLLSIDANMVTITLPMGGTGAVSQEVKLPAPWRLAGLLRIGSLGRERGQWGKAGFSIDSPDVLRLAQIFHEAEAMRPTTA